MDEGVSEQGWYDEELEALIWDMGGTFGNYGGEEEYVWDFGKETCRKGQLGRPRPRREDNKNWH